MSTLVHLKVLNLSENHLNSVSEVIFFNQISDLPRLEKLYISYNKIESIAKLKNLPMLETFHICANRLKNLEGMESFVLLKILWVAGNKLYSFKNHLEKLQFLEEVNASANKICHFNETLNLLRNPEIKTLYFKDPQFGNYFYLGCNPICSLCNYETFIIFHFPKL
jgi:Leucine-rich repeat (LRR) protein